MITRTCNEIEKIVIDEIFDEVTLMEKEGKLNELLGKIQEFDQMILDLYLASDEAGYEEEMMTIDNYSSEIRTARIKIDRKFRQVQRNDPVNHPQSEYSTATSSRRKHTRKFKLPKIELLKFSSKLIDW